MGYNTTQCHGSDEDLLKSRARSLRIWTSSLALSLELLIATYVFVFLTVMLTGGFDLWWISAHGAAKPILVLAIVVPARIALGGPSRLIQVVWASGVSLNPLATAVSRVRLTPAVRDVTFALLVTRPATFAIAFMFNLLYPPRRVRPFRMPFIREKFFEIFAAWDSGWYFDIARRGYDFSPNAQSSIAFFPLYPMLMRLVAWPLGGSDQAVWSAGILISWVAFAAALLILHCLTEECLGNRQAARRTVCYVAVFPFSFFFTRVYSESLFLLLSLLAVRAGYHSRWWQAGTWGALAALTRPNGILIAVPLICFALMGRPSLSQIVRRGAALSLVPLGLAAFCLYLYSFTGDPFAWLGAQRHWNYSLGHLPWRQLLKLIDLLERYGLYGYFFTSRLAPFYFFHGAVAMLFVMLTPHVFKRLGMPFGAYVLVSLLIPLTASTLQGFGRYSAVLFPVFMLLGSLRSERLHETILVGSSLFLALFISLFVTWHPIY